jgi:N-acetylglutamate synthase-like GNAT family acetyltransferase
MDMTLTIRRADSADFAAIDRLLAESYPRLLAPDYPPSVLVTALPIISRARPELVVSGRYFVAEEAGRIMGAGGWSMAAPGDGAVTRATGHIRHVVTDYRVQRQGIGRQLMQVVLADATDAGIRMLECLSTLTARAFYESLGFRALAPIMVPLRPGIDFSAIRMVMEIA